MGKRERRGRWVENPEDIGEISDPNFVRLPDTASLFSARASRLSQLADGSHLAPYLSFLAALVTVQHEAAGDLARLPLLDAETLDTRLAASMPPLAPDLLGEAGADAFLSVLDNVLARLDGSSLPVEGAAARARALAMGRAERLALAEMLFTGSYPADQLGEALFVAAALQVFVAGCAAGLSAHRLRPVGDGVCPVCGSAPVASLIVSWPGANHVRYCACSLCQTLWNYVRIKCTSCGSTEKIAYFSSDVVARNAAVETCGVCRCYIKHLHSDDDPAIDPVADDIATFGLDLLIRQDDFRPGGLNPLFISA